MKVSETAAQELPLNDEKLDPVFIPKPNRHIAIAVNHMKKRRDTLTAQIEKLTGERDGIDNAVKALE